VHFITRVTLPISFTFYGLGYPLSRKKGALRAKNRPLHEPIFPLAPLSTTWFSNMFFRNVFFGLKDFGHRQDNPFTISTMEIVLLGSGTATPLPYRASPALALFSKPSRFILVDIGPGTIRQLSLAGLSHQNIGHLFLSHFHPDHTAGIIDLLFITRSPSVFPHRRPFSIIGAQGLEDFIRALQAAYGDSLELDESLLTLQELGQDQGTRINSPNFKVISAPMSHTSTSLAYRFEDGDGRAVVYSGDTGYCRSIVDLAREADLLILECSFPDDRAVEGHLTPSLAGRIAAEAGVQRVLLTHFYPECLATDIVSQCRRQYGGEITLGSDLVRLRI